MLAGIPLLMYLTLPAHWFYFAPLPLSLRNRIAANSGLAKLVALYSDTAALSDDLRRRGEQWRTADSREAALLTANVCMPWWQLRFGFYVPSSSAQHQPRNY